MTTSEEELQSCMHKEFTTTVGAVYAFRCDAPTKTQTAERSWRVTVTGFNMDKNYPYDLWCSGKSGRFSGGFRIEDLTPLK